MGVRFRARRRAVNGVVVRAAQRASNRRDITAVAVVGSYAAGRSRMGSDLDLVILSERVEEHLQDLDFVHVVAPGGRVVRCEQWGPMRERRVRL